MKSVTLRLEPGTRAPLFTLPDQDGQPVSLADYRGQKVVLYFYPQAMTPACTTQACEFRDNSAALAAAGYAVIGISPDEAERLGRFRDRDALTFPLLSDPEHTALTAYGAWGEKINYGRTYEGVIRSTFIIDEEGIITTALYNVKATGHVARVVKLLGLETATT